MNLPRSGFRASLLPLLCAALWASATPSHADNVLDRIKQRIMERRDNGDRRGAEESLEAPDGGTASEARFRVLRDVPYGNDALQKMDVYLPDTQAAGPAPVIFMVHGGAWRTGDKRNGNVVDNKAHRWLAKGLVFVSINNRLLPEADPLDQVRDVAQALSVAQNQARSWGADPKQFVLMGHSAGAHLVALLSASSVYGPQAGAQGWLGSVLLDSAALDVAGIMKARHYKLYDPAFGTDPDFRRAVSPLHQLQGAAKPMLAVCSTRRGDSCAQAQAFSQQALVMGVKVQVSGQDLSHGEINKNLGLAGNYTDTVEGFLATLSPALSSRLR